MCGIAGFVHDGGAAGAPLGRAELLAMARAMAHRGPDGEGFLERGRVGFAFRRLSIIDRAGGDQPIFNETGRIAIVFNGEIYNFRELRVLLEEKGHRFRTRSDTEVIVHGYEEWGERGVLERLRGMFAFAIHDADRDRVVLARDRLGIKPLHLWLAQHGVGFASELKSLFALARLPRRLDAAALLDYATLGYVPAPRSILKDVVKLEPGHFAVADGTGLRRERYWRAPFEEQEAALVPAAERLKELLAEAVRMRLVAEVPLGCFLSGGMDSSAVAAAMRAELGPTLTAVTVGFADRRFDEREPARRVAEHLGIRPVVEMAEIDPHLLEPLAETFDEPHADPSNVPTYVLCRAARRHVTVALSGDGGDELFAGYRRYRFDQLENRLRALVPGGVRGALFKPLGAAWPKADWLPRGLRAKSLIENVARDPVEAYHRSVARVAPEEVERLAAPELLAAAGTARPLDRFREIDRQRRLADPLFRVRAIDLETWLPDDILAKVDRASMAHSLEVRVPVLDHHLVEFATGLPARLLLRRGAGKRVFRRALRGTLPDATLDRRKQGFDLPVKAWLGGPLAADLDRITRPGSALEGCFRLERARELVGEQRRGLRDRTAELWMLVTFERWWRRWMATCGS